MELDIDHSEDNRKPVTPAADSASSAEVAMKTYIQLNVYRLQDGNPEYLLVERSDGGKTFWQPLSQEVQAGAMLVETLTKIMAEQAGITDFKHLSQAVYTYEWYTNGRQGRDIIFSAKVSADSTITPQPGVYTNYCWLPFTEAVQQMKWNGNKEALRRLQAIISQNQAAGIYADDDKPEEPVEDPSAMTVEALSFGDPYAALRQPAPEAAPTQPAAPARKPMVIGLPLYTGPGASLPTDDEPMNVPIDNIIEAAPYSPAAEVYTDNQPQP